MADDVVSARGLNRALLARQHLLERSDAGIPQVLEDMGGLQMQYAPSGYIGLWSRMADFPRASLTAALEARDVVQATLLRATIHLTSPRDYLLLTEGIRRTRREWWVRVAGRDVDRLDLDAIAAVVRSLLADGPRRHADMLSDLAERGYPRMAWQTAGMLVDMVRVPPSGTWERRRADLYGLAEQWVGPPTVTEDQGLEHAVVRYLGAFGPAPPGDIAKWAGVPATTLRPIVAAMTLRRLRDDSGHELLDLPDATLPDPQTPAPVRFLPTWDATLLVHARRTGVLPEQHRTKIFSNKTPQSVPTFLVDGAVAGTWRYESGTVTVTPFEALPRRVAREVDDEAGRLAVFHRG